jgi:putative amide transporter protein
MVAVALMLYAAVVFVNAFFLLGRVDGRAAGPINLIGGVLGVLVAYFIFASDPKGGAAFAAVLVGSFAVLFLMVGAVLTWGFEASAPGYYSILGAVISLLFAFTVMGADMRLALMALSYAALFLLFAAILAFGRPLQKFTGYFALAVVFGALVLPSFMMMTNRW